MQTVNAFLKGEGRRNPHLAMFCLGTAPIDHNLPSPCERLNGRRYKANLPAESSKCISATTTRCMDTSRTIPALQRNSQFYPHNRLSAESYSETVGHGQGHKQSKHAQVVQYPDRTWNRVQMQSARLPVVRESD